MLRLTVFLILSIPAICAAEELRVPAATVYLDPDAEGARVSKEQGVTRWTDPKTAVVWFGQLNHVGQLEVSLDLFVKGAVSTPVTLEISPVPESSAEIDFSENIRTQPAHSWKTTSGPVTNNDQAPTRVKMGSVTVKNPGYFSFRLTLASVDDRVFPDVKALILDGPAAKDAHFNMLPRRNAASVHLAYPVDRDTDVSAFYCEMTGVEDPLWTYYMACGWHRGYFGMQVNSPTERRIIFSVWDSGNEAISRDKVGDENRVQLMAKGDGVYSGDFGNEGTGGHSHLKYWWKTGQKQKFLVTAEPVSETHTIYAGYYFHPDSKKWMLISSWKAPKEGKYMRGLYSFSENFIGRNGHVVRKALYGNQWIRTAAGEWIEITTAKFSHDQTGKADRLDRFMGLEDGQFFLSHGGFVDGFTEFGRPFTREPSGESPATMDLPPLPAAK